MDFKESVKVYLESCKNNKCCSVGQGTNGKESAVYTPSAIRIKAIKPFEAVRQLVELGIPKNAATEAVRKAMADKTKIQSITDRLCCECAEEINSLSEEFEDEKSAMNDARRKAALAKQNAYDAYKTEKFNSKKAAREERIKNSLAKKTAKYEHQAERYAQGSSAVKSDKIKRTIAGILMAAALGGAAVGVNKADPDFYTNAKQSIENYKDGREAEKTKGWAAKNVGNVGNAENEASIMRMRKTLGY